MPACHEFMQNCLTKKILLYKIPISLGAIAQLVEHLHGMQGVSGSTPLSSTIIFVILLRLSKPYFKKSQHFIFLDRYHNESAELLKISHTKIILLRPVRLEA